MTSTQQPVRPLDDGDYWTLLRALDAREATLKGNVAYVLNLDPLAAGVRQELRKVTHARQTLRSLQTALLTYRAERGGMTTEE